MTREDKEIIDDILTSPSRLRESYIKNNYLNFYNKVLSFINDNNLPKGITYKEKLYYFINEIKEKICCKICKSDVNFNRNFKDGYKNYCSAKCAQQNPETKKKRKLTTIKKYGVDNIAKLEETSKKRELTNLERYKSKSSFQNENVKKKWKENIKDKYGVDHVFQLESIKDKIKKTNREKYGTDYFVQSDEYKIHLEENNHSENMKKTYFEKTIKTNKDKYGNFHYLSSDKHKKLMSEKRTEEYLNKKNIEFWKNNFNNLEEYKFIKSHKKERSLKLKRLDCGHVFKIKNETFYKRYYNKHNCCLECLPLNSISQSSLELQLGEFLDSLGIDYIPNYNKYGIEMDVYIPSYNIAIEMNGLYWHSELKKHKMFHIKKTNICEENGIQLIHIWEDDWLYKRSIIKSILLNRLNLIKSKIYARKCEVREVSPKESRIFLNDNHIQGYSPSKIKLGLYYNDKIVSLMTFSERNINSKREMELVRFCSKLNTNVIGGSSKLFKFFLRNYEYSYITSYADVSMFDGELYKTLGFDFKHRSKPNYYWVIGGIRHHRFNFNKKKLIKEGFDPNKTEKEIMYERGSFRIWGCGQDKYLYEN